MAAPKRVPTSSFYPNMHRGSFLQSHGFSTSTTSYKDTAAPKASTTDTFVYTTPPPKRFDDVDETAQEGEHAENEVAPNSEFEAALYTPYKVYNDERMIGRYPRTERKMAHEKDDYYPYYDTFDRRDFNQPLHEDSDVLLMIHGPDAEDISVRDKIKRIVLILFYVYGVAGLCCFLDLNFFHVQRGKEQMPDDYLYDPIYRAERRGEFMAKTPKYIQVERVPVEKGNESVWQV